MTFSNAMIDCIFFGSLILVTIIVVANMIRTHWERVDVMFADIDFMEDCVLETSSIDEEILGDYLEAGSKRYSAVACSCDQWVKLHDFIEQHFKSLEKKQSKMCDDEEKARGCLEEDRRNSYIDIFLKSLELKKKSFIVCMQEVGKVPAGLKRYEATRFAVHEYRAIEGLFKTLNKGSLVSVSVEEMKDFCDASIGMFCDTWSQYEYWEDSRSKALSWGSTSLLGRFELVWSIQKKKV